MLIKGAGDVADLLAVNQAGGAEIAQGFKQFFSRRSGIAEAGQEEREVGTVEASRCCARVLGSQFVEAGAESTQ